MVIVFGLEELLNHSEEGHWVAPSYDVIYKYFVLECVTGLALTMKNKFKT